MCNKNQALKILNEVYDLCNTVYNNKISSAYLYGSYARGDYTDESDIDILITAEMSAEKIAENRQRLAEITSNLSLRYDITVSVTVKPLEQFTKYSSVLPYYKNVLREGIRHAV